VWCGWEEGGRECVGVRGLIHAGAVFFLAALRGGYDGGIRIA